MSDFRLVDFNYPFQSNVDIDFTTEDTSFPADNIKASIRSKAWRSSKDGNFVITSSINKINFKESGGGGELTATIVVATYTASALATEIKTQLEVAGAETYTVTYSQLTGLWTIATGGAFLSILWSTGTDTASTIGGTLGFDTSSDATGALTYTGASIAIHTEESITVDIQTIDAVDTFALVFDPFEGIKFTPTATVKLRASLTPNFTGAPVSITLTIDELHHVSTNFFTSDQNFRFWNVQIVDPTNPNLQVELHKIILGRHIGLGQNPEIGFTYQTADESKTRETLFGHAYSDIYPIKKGFAFDFKIMDFTDVEILADSYNRVGNTDVVAMAVDTTETLFDKERFFLYGRYRGSIKFKQNFQAIFSEQLSLEETF